MRTKHNINEDYSNYIKRNVLKNYRTSVKGIIVLIVLAVLIVFVVIIEKTKLHNSDVAVVIGGWGFIILAGYLGYKFYKKYYIPKRRYTRSELMNTYE